MPGDARPAAHRAGSIPASVIAAIEWGAGYVRLRDLGRYVPDVEARSRELGGGGSPVAAAVDAVGQ